MAKQTKAFQAEVKEILDLVVHSLYSNRGVFLRELISNASDAIDKLRFESVTHPDWDVDRSAFEIRLTPNKENHTLTISDNGIGMSYDEVLENIGTIAHSGTKEFVQRAKELKDRPELIGQFGVGFYSAFMVADKVTLHTQKVGSNEGVLWESTGDGSFTVDEVPRAQGRGTTITLHLKEFKDDESAQDFTEEWTLRSSVKKYSDFIQFPIKMAVQKEVPVKDDKGEVVEGETKTVIEDEVLNSQKALWLQSPQEVKDEQYNEFYKHLTHDWSEPLKTIHFKAEGVQEFAALLFIPSQVPFDYNLRETKYGLSLYVKRVFIMDHCEELLPQYLRFMKGLVDSSDLSLNVSREILQQDYQVQQIRKALVGKVLSQLKDILKKDRETYEKFWGHFGATLKEGLPSDYANKDKLKDLVLFRSTHADGYTTLQEYVDRMKKEQKSIYYLTGESIDQLKNSPYLEKLKEKDFEVLLLTDAVDEWVVSALDEYADKKVVSITSENLDIESEEEKKAKEEELKEKETKFKPLTERLKEALANQVREVRVSDRLTETPACLVSGANDPSARMERIVAAMGQDVPKSKRILEINPAHPVIQKMLSAAEDHQKEWGEILYNQALLNEGSPIEDPVKFSRQITRLMSDANV